MVSVIPFVSKDRLRLEAVDEFVSQSNIISLPWRDPIKRTRLGRPAKWFRRTITNALLYVLRSGLTRNA